MVVSNAEVAPSTAVAKVASTATTAGSSSSQPITVKITPAITSAITSAITPAGLLKTVAKSAGHTSSLLTAVTAVTGLVTKAGVAAPQTVTVVTRPATAIPPGTVVLQRAPSGVTTVRAGPRPQIIVRPRLKGPTVAVVTGNAIGLRGAQLRGAQQRQPGRVQLVQIVQQPGGGQRLTTAVKSQVSGHWSLAGSTEEFSSLVTNYY